MKILFLEIRLVILDGTMFLPVAFYNYYLALEQHVCKQHEFKRFGLPLPLAIVFPPAVLQLSASSITIWYLFVRLPFQKIPEMTQVNMTFILTVVFKPDPYKDSGHSFT